MSQFIGNAMPQFILQLKDKRLVPNYQAIRKERDRISERASATQYPGGYATAFWPGNRGFIGDQATDVALQEPIWSRPLARLGHGEASRVGFPGITRDQYGAPLGSCTVVLHRTSTREFVHEMVSDANGVFLSQSVYAGEGHYIWFHKAGSVNVYGATDNNLIGA